MRTKLNLTIEEDLVKGIKKFAKENNSSVSKIVSEQIKIILTESDLQKTPFSQRAAGIVKGNKLNDLNKLRDEYLKEKYGL